jgi:predicted component of type VI protein secretion system
MIGIQIVSCAGAPPPAPTTAWFGPEGGDIGRSAECTLSLPDPDRHISRRHAQVSLRQGRYMLQALSAGVAVVLDGTTLNAGEEQPLVGGMRITIGAYTLQVLDEPDLLVPTRSQPVPVRPPQPMAVDLLVGGTGEVKAPMAPPAPPAVPDWGQALQRGLGVGIGALGPEQAQRVGELLRAMTEGTLGLLTARMVAKRELGAAGTQLRTRENNPLKFSPDVDAALSHLLGPAERGFLEPQAAVLEAFDDLRAHQVALLAGMRAALDTVMSRFDPAALEQRLAPGGALENLIPANRRARLWSAYAEEYARIVGEVEDDFDALLGRAFLKAYQAQLQALAADRKRTDPKA